MVRAALDVAAEEVASHGWDGLQVQTVAARVGVSRQTLYNAFGNKHGLARALVLRLTEQFLDGIEEALVSENGVADQWRRAVSFTLDAASADPLLKSVLVGDGGGDDLLPLLTSEGGPIVAAARERLADVVRAARPGVTRDVAADVAETATRLVISHLVLPLHSTGHVADGVASVVEALLDRATPETAAVGNGGPDRPV